MLKEIPTLLCAEKTMRSGARAKSVAVAMPERAKVRKVPDVPARGKDGKRPNMPKELRQFAPSDDKGRRRCFGYNLGQGLRFAGLRRSPGVRPRPPHLHEELMRALPHVRAPDYPPCMWIATLRPRPCPDDV